MDPTPAQLVDFWLCLPSTGMGRAESRFFADELLDDWVRESPKLVWDFLLDISGRTLKDKQISMLGAGLLETLLSMHGAEFISSVEQEAARNETFKRILRGVWQSSTPDSIWSRVQKAQQ